MATAAAREGRRVLVVDGDTHGKALSKVFEIDQTNGGLTELMAGLVAFEEVRRPIGVGGAATLDLLPDTYGIFHFVREQHFLCGALPLLHQQDVEIWTRSICIVFYRIICLEPPR